MLGHRRVSWRRGHVHSVCSAAGGMRPVAINTNIRTRIEQQWPFVRRVGFKAGKMKRMCFWYEGWNQMVWFSMITHSSLHSVIFYDHLQLTTSRSQKEHLWNKSPVFLLAAAVKSIKAYCMHKPRFKINESKVLLNYTNHLLTQVIF